MELKIIEAHWSPFCDTPKLRDDADYSCCVVDEFNNPVSTIFSKYSHAIDFIKYYLTKNK